MTSLEFDVEVESLALGGIYHGSCEPVNLLM